MGIQKVLKSNKFTYRTWLYYDLYIKSFKKKTKKYYSQYGEDKEIAKFFENKKKGTYFDIGCFHPIKYNNTYFLFKKGWNGTNIDINKASIDLFNIARPKDNNICAAVSDSSIETNLFVDDILGPVNTIDENTYKKSKEYFFKDLKIKKIKTAKIYELIPEDLLLKKTDFLNIDAEGSDYKIISQVDLKSSNIQLVAIETHDPNGNKLVDCDNIEQLFENHRYFINKRVGPTTLYAKKNN